jgi:hypothetical protein
MPIFKPLRPVKNLVLKIREAIFSNLSMSINLEIVRKFSAFVYFRFYECFYRFALLSGTFNVKVYTVDRLISMKFTKRIGDLLPYMTKKHLLEKVL